MSAQEKKSSLKPQVLIVEASAGSGKTYALAQRYLELLFHSPQPSLTPFRSILAITFSNKAAHEMKERILFSLKKIALDQFSSPSEKEQFLQALGVPESQALKKAQSLMEELFGQYNFFQVATIDSFVNALLCGCAFYLDLSASFRIKKDPRDYLVFALDKLIDSSHKDKKILGLFQKFIRQYLFLENRAGWFLKQDIQKMISRFFSTYNKYRGGFAPTHNKPEDVIVKKHEILEKLKQLHKNLPSGVYAMFEKKLGSFLRENIEIFDVEDLSAYFCRDQMPLKKGHTVPPEISDLWQDISFKIKELVEEESRSVFCYYIEIFEAVRAELRLQASDEDILFLDELNRQARRLFDDKFFTVPELYFRLSARLHHFLIDEFQDTSVLQWENIFPLVEEALSCGGSLFYVGDKKQAIYRFRGGEALLFDKVKQHWLEFGPQSFSLQKNYRSPRAIVEFCNDIFCDKNLRRFLLNLEDGNKEGYVLNAKGIGEILDIFKGSAQSYRAHEQPGFVSIECVPCANKEEYEEAAKEKLISLFKDLNKRFDYKDIAVLVRENDDVEILTSWLLQNNIPVASDKTLNIRNSSLIKEMISLLKFLDSPVDNLAFASFITGEIFAKSSGLDNKCMRNFIFEFRQKDHRNNTAYLYSEFRRQFPEIWKNFLEDFFKNAGFLPLYEFLVSIISRFNCLSSFGEAQGFFMKLLELVKDNEEEARDIAGFLEYFKDAKDEDLYVKVCDPLAVRILTIHKAKGLGFPVVVIPFFDIRVKVPTQVTEVSGDSVAFLRLTEKNRLFSEELKEVYLNEYKKSLIDELNTAYVALTRAMNELYCFMPGSTTKNKGLAAFFIGDKIGCHGVKKEFSRQPKPESSLVPMPSSSYQDWIKLLKDEFSDVSSPAHREERLRGEMIHKALYYIGDLSQKDCEAVLIDAFKNMRNCFQHINDFSAVEDVVRRVITSKDYRQFFYTGQDKVYQEKEIVDKNGMTKRIDRLIVKEKEAWVIDFKSSKDMALVFEEQLKNYRNILQDIYPDKKIRGFVIYYDSMTVDEII